MMCTVLMPFKVKVRLSHRGEPKKQKEKKQKEKSKKKSNETALPIELHALELGCGSMKPHSKSLVSVSQVAVKGGTVKCRSASRAMTWGLWTCKSRSWALMKQDQFVVPSL